MSSTFNKSLRCFLVCSLLLTPAYTLAETTEKVTKEQTQLTPEEQVKLAEKAFNKADLISAIKHYRKAAEAGYAPAMVRLGYKLDKAEKNEEAIEWFKKAATLGDAEAQFELARMYAYGEGIKKDNKKALNLFTQSAKQNHVRAIHVLALAYEEGGLELRVDYELAQYWLRHGQKINDDWSIKRLAQAYRKGELGLRINQKKTRQLELQLEKLEQQRVEQQRLKQVHLKNGMNSHAA